VIIKENRRIPGDVPMNGMGDLNASGSANFDKKRKAHL
jgi:hypothetical protein